MDIKNNLDFRKGNLLLCTRNEYRPYNYAKEGVLSKCLPKILFNGNPILSTFLQLIDLRIIMLLKYVDKLKLFKKINLYY